MKKFKVGDLVLAHNYFYGIIIEDKDYYLIRCIENTDASLDDYHFVGRRYASVNDSELEYVTDENILSRLNKKIVFE